MRSASHRAKCERVRGWHRRTAQARSPSPPVRRLRQRARRAGRDRWCDELLQALTEICGFIGRQCRRWRERDAQRDRQPQPREFCRAGSSFLTFHVLSSPVVRRLAITQLPDACSSCFRVHETVEHDRRLETEATPAPATIQHGNAPRFFATLRALRRNAMKRRVRAFSRRRTTGFTAGVADLQRSA